MEVKTEVEEKKPSDKTAAKKNGLLTRFKKIKHIEIIVALIAVAVMLVIYFSSKAGTSGAENNGSAAVSAENYCQRIERELSETLSKVGGAGEVRVLIAWESGIESVIAYITNSSQNSVSQSPQIISGNGGQSPVVLKEIYPKVTGILIVSEGADNPKTKLDIIMAVSAFLSVPADKIQVLTTKG